MAEVLAPAAALACGGSAPADDAEPGQNPIALYFRHVVQERLRMLFPPGARVLDLGCGTGEDALYLASLGVDVHGIDVSPARIHRAREKASKRSSPHGSVRFEVKAPHDLDSIDGAFDGAYSGVGALGEASLGVVGSALLRRLRSGALLAFCVAGPRPFPRLLEQTLTGPSARSADRRTAARPRPAPGLSLADLREGLGPGFSWDTCAGLGILVPAPVHEDWARRHPLAFGFLAAAERLVRQWPVARERGHHLLALGTRD